MVDKQVELWESETTGQSTIYLTFSNPDAAVVLFPVHCPLDINKTEIALRMHYGKMRNKTIQQSQDNISGKGQHEKSSALITQTTTATRPVSQG